MKKSKTLTYSQLRKIITESLNEARSASTIFDLLDTDPLILGCDPRWTSRDEDSFLMFVANAKGIKDEDEASMRAQAGKLKMSDGKEYRRLLRDWSHATNRPINYLGIRGILNTLKLDEMYGDDPDDYKTDKNGNYLRDKNGRKIPKGFEDDIAAALDKVRGLTSRLKDNIMAAIFNGQPSYSMEESTDGHDDSVSKFFDI